MTWWRFLFTFWYFVFFFKVHNEKNLHPLLIFFSWLEIISLHRNEKVLTELRISPWWRCCVLAVLRGTQWTPSCAELWTSPRCHPANIQSADAWNNKRLEWRRSIAEPLRWIGPCHQCHRLLAWIGWTASDYLQVNYTVTRTHRARLTFRCAAGAVHLTYLPGNLLTSLPDSRNLPQSLADIGCHQNAFIPDISDVLLLTDQSRRPWLTLKSESNLTISGSLK